jgi:hypothetical protein
VAKRPLGLRESAAGDSDISRNRPRGATIVS